MSIDKPWWTAEHVHVLWGPSSMRTLLDKFAARMLEKLNCMQMIEILQTILFVNYNPYQAAKHVHMYTYSYTIYYIIYHNIYSMVFKTYIICTNCTIFDTFVSLTRDPMSFKPQTPWPVTTELKYPCHTARVLYYEGDMCATLPLSPRLPLCNSFSSSCNLSRLGEYQIQPTIHWIRWKPCQEVMSMLFQDSRFKMFQCAVPLCTHKFLYVHKAQLRSIDKQLYDMPSMSWSWWFLPEAVTDHGSDPSLPAVFQFPQKQRNSTQVNDTCCWGDQKNGSEDDDHHVSWSSKDCWKPSFTPVHSSPPAALDHAPQLMAISPKQDTYKQRQ